MEHRRQGVDSQALVIGMAGTMAALAWSGRPSYWFDEAATVSAASRPLPQLWRLLHHVDAVHGLYYLLMHGWVTLFGSSEVATRSFSALGLGVACAGTAALGRLLDGPGLGLAAGIVSVLLPGLSWSGLEARQYSWSAASAVLATLLLVRADRSGRRADWGWYAVVVAVGAYLFLLSLLLLAAHLVTLLLVRRPLRGWLAAAGLAVALSLPVLYVGSMQRDRQLSWLSMEWLPMLERAVVRLYFLGLNSPPPTPARAGALVLLSLAVALAVTVLVRARHDPGVRSTVALAIPWATVPPAVVVGATLLGVPLYEERYLTFCAPGLAILLGAGLVGLRRHVGLLVAVCVVGVLATLPVSAAQRAVDAKREENYRGLADFLGPGGQDVQAVALGASDGLGVLLVYPDRTGRVPVANLLAAPGPSGSLWGRVGRPAQERALSPHGRLGLINWVERPRQARPWLRWFHRHGCRRAAAMSSTRFVVRTFDCGP